MGVVQTGFSFDVACQLLYGIYLHMAAEVESNKLGACGCVWIYCWKKLLSAAKSIKVKVPIPM